MSVAIMSVVWSAPPCGGAQLLVLLALADNANDDNRCAWPSVATLARKTAMSERSVQRALRTLEEDGLIAVRRQGGRKAGGGYQTTIWEVLPQGRQGRQIDAHEAGRGDNSGPPGVTPLSPEPSGEPSMPPAGMDSRASAKLKFGGKPMDPKLWERTRRTLDEFNRQAGTSFVALDGAGAPSENAKRIYGRLRAWPDLADKRIAEIIRLTLASKWWGSAKADDVGPVFGPKVWERNMARRPGDPPERGATRAAKEEERRRQNERGRAAIERLMKRDDANNSDGGEEVVEGEVVDA